MTVSEIREKLLFLADEGYKNFQAKLMPTVDKDKIIGVRTPVLRAFAKELWKAGEYGEFLSDLPHKYYEEDNLHAFLIEMIKDFGSCCSELDRFLPYVDNWATCDCLRPKVLKKQPQELMRKIRQWLKSDEVYTVRFAIGCLMSYYLDENFKEEYLELVASIKSEEYYINMMIAWYFATALAKQYDSAVVYLREKRLSPWVHQKTIQKAVESYRITPGQKEYLRTLR